MFKNIESYLCYLNFYIHIFSIRVTDSVLQQTTVKKLKTVQICNCNTVDASSICLNTIQQYYSSNAVFLACQCSSAYTGNFCTDLKDFCIAKPCNSSQTCHTKSSQLQTAGNEYKCCDSGLAFNANTATCETRKFLII